MSKTSADIRRQKPQKKSESQGEQDRGTSHHSVIPGSRDRWTEWGRKSFKDHAGSRLSPVGSHTFQGGAHAGVASVLTPLTSWPSVPSVLQESFPDTHHPALLSQTLLEQEPRLLPTYAWVTLQDRTVTTSCVSSARNPTPGEPGVFPPNSVSSCECY